MRRTEGCVGALIMGTDGLAVEKVRQAGTIAEANLEASATEFAAFAKNMQQAAVSGSSSNNSSSELRRFGRLREMSFTGEGDIFILRFVNDDYFIDLVLSPPSSFGRGEFLLEKELAI